MTIVLKVFSVSGGYLDLPKELRSSDMETTNIFWDWEKKSEKYTKPCFIDRFLL